VNAAIRSWTALVGSLRPDDQRRPLRPKEIANARIILPATLDALSRAAADRPNRLRVVRGENDR
jgi:hypothetical protein